MLRHLCNDLRYAARRLASTPGFTAAAVITIALGVGINTGVFSVLNGLALRELPARDAGDLVAIHQILDDATMRQRPRSGDASRFSTSEYRTYRDGAQTLSGIMGYTGQYLVTLGGEVPREIVGTLVTCNYFDVLRQPPALGPGFRPDCDAEGSAPTVVLAHDVWTSAFGSDPTIVGREVLLNRQPFTVVGVAPEGMRGVALRPVSYFAPISAQPQLRPSQSDYRDEWSWLILIGRKAENMSLDRVRAELGVIAAQIDAQRPPRETTIVVSRASPNSSPEEREQLLTAGVVVMAAFGLVLLLACANVANLLLARATGRSREIAVRLSLGASRGRIVQQLLAESVLIAIIGGVLGSVLAMWSFQSLLVFAESDFSIEGPGLIDASPDVRVLAFAFVSTLASGVLFGLVPALQGSKQDLHMAMKVNGSGRPGANRLQSVLVGVQVAACMVLMISAGLLVRGLYAAQTVEPGFTYEDVAVASFDLTGYDTARAGAFQRELTERVGSLPDVDAVAQSAATPLAEGGMGSMARVPGGDRPFALRFNVVSPGYFALLELPIVRGRTFTETELAAGSAAVIVTEATARRLWPDRDPLGETLTMALGPNPAAAAQNRPDYQVIGVAKDAQIIGIGEVPSNYVYFPTSPGWQRGLRLLVKSHVDFGATAAGIRAAAASLDPGLVVRVAPLEANLEIWRSLAGLVSSLSTSLGALALALVSVGVYGVVAAAVGRRTREIGIRMALGANRRSVVALMLKRTMRPVIVGATIGIAASVGVSRVLSSVLFGVSPVDPLALIGSVLVVATVAVAAGTLPARRAARIDPNWTLHHD